MSPLETSAPATKTAGTHGESRVSFVHRDHSESKGDEQAEAAVRERQGVEKLGVLVGLRSRRERRCLGDKGSGNTKERQWKPKQRLSGTNAMMQPCLGYRQAISLVATQGEGGVVLTKAVETHR